ncbi:MULTISPECIES: asparagine synthase (glutamine-hydrolyzing) [Janthinobacterium]|uniref:asparagine synthase (glutamine-hydrolyzing) n=1 Tax=Janthinobacterium kumbetense TaxID=2950280 RepID=A0ABT0WT11_9BURK|nr:MULTISPECIES: asparagine synthase (glutamine-hydrolyzing) [Janthinobacterium]MCM2566569.1 asparagine synthase (glutamine-hydrolyzing) [Janthinobacterium kumbetense]MDO8069361.1 asparagine synthase (glutamine-hydrolyzing) [Janthinobacterium sp. SUN206]MDO8075267.1 asparagine synthase (glutamine-hydrolyzing) [Janthinobacterium sp. SUN176]
MCGIAGLIFPSSVAGLPAALDAMGRAIAHRGPDDTGVLNAATADGAWQVGLLHRRLSIIDIATGHQPLGNETGDVQIIFNGEIYNFQPLRDELIALGHHFRTASDTETIVHAYVQWGEECVQHFRGMFAFAIWDARNDRLFMARDPFGKKPLFLWQHEGKLAFGSEIKALLALPDVAPQADEAAIWDYFAYRYVPGPATLFQGIRKLAPGSTATWENGVLRERVYYTPPDSRPRLAAPLPADPVATFLDKLDESVRIRMISDVPFGAFLSGGIDSSAVVALMSRHAGVPVKTFSVGFKEGGFSELAYAADIARQFSTEHHELEVSVDQVIALLPDLVRFRDAPVAEPSDIPIYLLAKESRKTVKMVLTGEGSDEILGGYPKHVYERYAGNYQMLPGLLRRGLIEPAIGALPYRFRRAKTAIVNLGLEAFHERMPRWFGMMSDQERARLVAMPAPARQRDPSLGCGSAGNSALRRILCFDQLSWLPDNLLERGDRMTMAASLEARMPFMDHELAAYVASLPDEYRVRGRTTKWILREAMKQLLPQAILERPKVGFRVPVNEWFRGPMKDYLYEHLTGAGSRTRHYYHTQALQQVLAEHVAGRQNHEKLLWSLLTLEIWHRQYL